MTEENVTQSISGEPAHDHMLIEGEKKPWSEGTVHIFWPSAMADKEDSKFVAWCREHAKGQLKEPSEILPLEDEKSYKERFCKTCLENAKKSQNVVEPEFLGDVESKIESSE